MICSANLDKVRIVTKKWYENYTISLIFAAILSKLFQKLLCFLVDLPKSESLLRLPHLCEYLCGGLSNQHMDVRKGKKVAALRCDSGSGASRLERYSIAAIFRKGSGMLIFLDTSFERCAI